MSDQPSKPLLIFPCNGNGIEALDCLGEHYNVIGFVDDTPAKQGRHASGYPVYDRTALLRWHNAEVLAVPGGPSSFVTRGQVITALGIDETRFARVIHPRATVSPLATIGRNVLIMAGVVVTSNAVIGDHVCLLPNSVVHHDVRIGRLSLVGSNVTLAGGVAIGENCYIASGTSIMHGIEIGAGALVGLGSNVIRNVAGGTTVAGNPARPI